MHALATSSALAIAFAMSACAPAPKAADAHAPQVESPSPSQRMGKRAAPLPGELVSPIIAARGGGPGWEIQIENTGGHDHHVELTWDNGKRGEGVLTLQPSDDGSDARLLLRGMLDAKHTTVELLKQACTGNDGITHEHALRVTVEGMAPMRGCGDLAI